MGYGKLLIAIIGLAVGVYSAALIVSDFRSRRVIAVAERIELGASLSSAEVQGFLSTNEQSIFYCRKDIQVARLATSFAVLDRILADPTAISFLNDARSQAITEWNEALKCFPLDGTIWASAAMTQLRLDGPTEKALAHAEISQLVSPLEVRALQQRIFFLIAFSQTGSKKANALLQEDIEILLRSGNRKLLSGINSLLGEYGRDKIREVLQSQEFHDALRASDPKRLKFLTKFYKVDPDFENCAPLLRRIDKCSQNTS